MKKLLLILALMVTTLSVTSCTEDTDRGKTNTPGEKNEVTKEVYPRTVDISSGIDGENETFDYSADFDFDGVEEEIEIRYDDGNHEYEWLSDLNISIGDYEYTVEEVDGKYLWAVYLCDMNVEDGVRDLAVLTVEFSGDPCLRIFKFEEDLPRYEFMYKHGDGKMESHGTGYAVTPYFNVNDDDTLTIEEQTDSHGMWSVYRDYKLNNDGAYEEIKKDEYEVLPDFMEQYDSPNDRYSGDVDKKEKNMWKKGYIMAHTDYISNGFTINEGEYIKVLLDDCNNNIFVEKENGDAGWISIDYSEFKWQEFNQFFFAVAG